MADQIKVSAGALSTAVHRRYQEAIGRLVEQVAMLEVALDVRTSEVESLRALMELAGAGGAGDAPTADGDS